MKLNNFFCTIWQDLQLQDVNNETNDSSDSENEKEGDALYSSDDDDELSFESDDEGNYQQNMNKLNLNAGVDSENEEGEGESDEQEEEDEDDIDDIESDESGDEEVIIQKKKYYSPISFSNTLLISSRNKMTKRTMMNSTKVTKVDYRSKKRKATQMKMSKIN